MTRLSRSVFVVIEWLGGIWSREIIKRKCFKWGNFDERRFDQASPSAYSIDHVESDNSRSWDGKRRNKTFVAFVNEIWESLARR